MPFHAVIFDLDGTLLDSLEDLGDSCNAMLAALGHPTHPMESYKQFVGNGMAVLVTRALPGGARADFDRGLELMRTEYKRRWNVKTKPYAGIPELLDGLAARNIPMTVLSNKPDDFCQITVRELLSGWSWAVVMGESPRYPRKPDPAGALAIAEKLGVAPEEVLFLGDTPMDVQCALNAGMTPVGATWGFRARHTLEEAGGKLFIDDPRELLGLL